MPEYVVAVSITEFGLVLIQLHNSTDLFRKAYTWPHSSEAHSNMR